MVYRIDFARISTEQEGTEEHAQLYEYASSKNINHTNDCDQNLLMMYLTIARPVDPVVISELLLEGIEINHTDIDGRSLLHYAAMNPTTTLEAWQLLFLEGA